MGSSKNRLTGYYALHPLALISTSITRLSHGPPDGTAVERAAVASGQNRCARVLRSRVRAVDFVAHRRHARRPHHRFDIYLSHSPLTCPDRSTLCTPSKPKTAPSSNRIKGPLLFDVSDGAAHAASANSSLKPCASASVRMAFAASSSLSAVNGGRALAQPGSWR